VSGNIILGVMADFPAPDNSVAVSSNEVLYVSLFP
jgi:hypothetical protein